MSRYDHATMGGTDWAEIDWDKAPNDTGHVNAALLARIDPRFCTRDTYGPTLAVARFLKRAGVA